MTQRIRCAALLAEYSHVSHSSILPRLPSQRCWRLIAAGESMHSFVWQGVACVVIANAC